MEGILSNNHTQVINDHILNTYYLKSKFHLYIQLWVKFYTKEYSRAPAYNRSIINTQ